MNVDAGTRVLRSWFSGVLGSLNPGILIYLNHNFNRVRKQVRRCLNVDVGTSVCFGILSRIPSIKMTSTNILYVRKDGHKRIFHEKFLSDLDPFFFSMISIFVISF